MRRAVIMMGLVLLAVGVVFGATAVPNTDLSAPVSTNPSFFVNNDNAHPVPVNITNGTVPVQVTERRRPFQISSNTDNFGTSKFRSFVFHVPDGQLLVIETVSVFVTVETGQKVRAEVLFQSGPVGGDQFLVGHHMLTLERVDGFGPGDTYATVRSMAGYAGGDEGVGISVERNSATGPGGRVSCAVTGYLIDAPIAAAF